jgi:hypothetical protein
VQLFVDATAFLPNHVFTFFPCKNRRLFSPRRIVCDRLWVHLLPYQTTSSPFFPVKMEHYFHLGGLCAPVCGCNCFPSKPFFPVKMKQYFHLGGMCATVCGCNCFPTKPRLHLFVLLDGTVFTSEDLRRCTCKPV